MKKPISHFFELKKKQIDTFLAASPHPSGGTGKNDRCAGGTLKIQHRFSVKNTLLNGEHYNCGYTTHRDHNASQNILALGLDGLGVSPRSLRL